MEEEAVNLIQIIEDLKRDPELDRRSIAKSYWWNESGNLRSRIFITYGWWSGDSRNNTEKVVFKAVFIGKITKRILQVKASRVFL